MELKKNCIPLSFVKEGSRVKVAQIVAGQGLKRRLYVLGLVPDAELEVVMNSLKGPFIITIKGSRIVIGHGIAQKIMVT